MAQIVESVSARAGGGQKGNKENAILTRDTLIRSPEMREVPLCQSRVGEQRGSSCASPEEAQRREVGEWKCRRSLAREIARFTRTIQDLVVARSRFCALNWTKCLIGFRVCSHKTTDKSEVHAEHSPRRDDVTDLPSFRPGRRARVAAAAARMTVQMIGRCAAGQSCCCCCRSDSSTAG